MWNRRNHEAGSTKIDQSDWFEWWYYKLILPESHEAFAIVFHVTNPWNKNTNGHNQCARVGTIDFINKIFTVSKWPLTEFSSSYDETKIIIGNNLATDKHISACIVDPKDNQEISFDVSIQKKWEFNAMGWMMPIPRFMNIYWFPAQADALFSGKIKYKDRLYHFENAPGYQDHNWGTSFPKWWTWIASNHFKDNPDSALVVGGGKPTVVNTFDQLESVTIGLKHKGHEYCFRPNDFSMVKTAVSFGTWKIDASNLFNRIEISAHAGAESFMNLQTPTPTGNLFNNYETLNGRVDVRLYKRTKFGRWQLADELHSDHAGIEYGCHEPMIL